MKHILIRKKECILQSVVTFYRFYDVFCKTSRWSVGRPVPPIRFSGPSGTGGKSSSLVEGQGRSALKIS